MVGIPLRLKIKRKMAVKIFLVLQLDANYLKVWFMGLIVNNNVIDQSASYIAEKW